MEPSKSESVILIKITSKDVQTQRKTEFLNKVCDYLQLDYASEYDREKLYERINLRVDIMVSNGLIDEVKSLVNAGLNSNHQSMTGIGYKEVYSYLQNEITIDECIELIKKNTRNYAKRQVTWFKKVPNLKWVNMTNGLTEDILNEIVSEYKKTTK